MTGAARPRRVRIHDQDDEDDAEECPGWWGSSPQMRVSTSPPCRPGWQKRRRPDPVIELTWPVDFLKPKHKNKGQPKTRLSSVDQGRHQTEEPRVKLEKRPDDRKGCDEFPDWRRQLVQSASRFCLEFGDVDIDNAVTDSQLFEQSHASPTFLLMRGLGRALPVPGRAFSSEKTNGCRFPC